MPEPIPYIFVPILPRQITATLTDPPGTIIPEPWYHYLLRVSLVQENNILYEIQQSIPARVQWILNQCDSLTAHQRAFRHIKIPLEIAFPRPPETPKPYEDPNDHPWTDAVDAYWTTAAHVIVPGLLHTLHGLEAKAVESQYYLPDNPEPFTGFVLIVNW